MTIQEQDAWYKTVEAFYKSRANTWRPKVEGIYKQAFKELSEHIQASGLQAGITEVDKFLHFADFAKTIQNIYIDAGQIMGGKTYNLVTKEAGKITRQIGKAYGVQLQTKAYIPIGYNEEIINAVIAYFQTDLISKAVLPITATMRQYIVKLLTESQQNGLGISEVIKKLENSNFPKIRAEVIARTETVKAANVGAVEGVKKTGIQTNKIWISARNNRTRRIPRDEFDHLNMNGVTVGFFEPFKVPRKGGYEEMMQPGDPKGSAGDVIQCRCTVGFKVLRGPDGLPLKI